MERWKGVNRKNLLLSIGIVIGIFLISCAVKWESEASKLHAKKWELFKEGKICAKCYYGQYESCKIKGCCICCVPGKDLCCCLHMDRCPCKKDDPSKCEK